MAQASEEVDVSGIDCAITTTITTSRATPVTKKQIAEDESLTAADRESLLKAAGVTAIYSKNFSWFTTGGGYTVTHDGRFYYNGTRAWVTVAYAGYDGYHSCYANYAIGLSISNEACTDTGSTSSRRLYYQWRVTWIIPPYTGISYSVSNTGYVYANGTTS